MHQHMPRLLDLSEHRSRLEGLRTLVQDLTVLEKRVLSASEEGMLRCSN